MSYVRIEIIPPLPAENAEHLARGLTELIAARCGDAAAAAIPVSVRGGVCFFVANAEPAAVVSFTNTRLHPLVTVLLTEAIQDLVARHGVPRERTRVFFHEFTEPRLFAGRNAPLHAER